MNAAPDREVRALRILHVFRAPLGGLFRHVIDLAAEQVRRGHDVGLFFDSQMREERVAAALAAVDGGFALGVHNTPIDRNPSPSDVFAMMRFAKVAKMTRPDIIHGHGSKGGLYARLPAFFGNAADAARAYTPHGGSFNYRPGTLLHRAYMAAEKALSLTTDVFLFESAYIARRFDEYVGVANGLRRIVANGIGPEEFTPIAADPDAADLVYVGELRAAKGIDTLIEAVAIGRREFGRRLTLALVGTGPDKELLSTQAHRLGVAAQISLLGALTARNAFRRGKLIVAPSRAESLPYVVLEAAGARVPIIATNVGGIPEIFGPFAGRLGPCDNPSDLCVRILAMMDLGPAERAAQSAELAAHVAANFSTRAMVDAVIDSYREALARRSLRASPAAAANLPFPT
jgi:glycosyltransferase involved in cell wall biosynthesis